VETAAAEVHARLAERAAAAVLARPHDRRLSGRGDMVLNGAYLVPLDGTPAFLSLADELRERHASEGVALELTGPWPAYHFVGGAS
jgi:Gas vesicle synthesis protein GvpL/GvpF